MNDLEMAKQLANTLSLKHNKIYHVVACECTGYSYDIVEDINLHNKTPIYTTNAHRT